MVLCLDVSADGTLLASSSKDATVRLWRARDGACVGLCEGHVEAVGAVTFARRKPMLFSGSKDKTVKLWDLRALPSVTTKAAAAKVVPLRTRSTALAHAKELNALAIAPNDHFVVSASQDRTLKVWAVADGALEEVATLKGHRRAVWCATFSPIDKLLASGSGDMTLKIWSMADYHCLRTLEGHTSSVLRVHWLSNGQQLLTSGSDGLVKLWASQTAECTATLDAHEDKIWALDVLETREGGVEVWSGSADALIVRWRDATQAVQQEQTEAKELELQQKQDLDIALHARQYRTAFTLALSLRQPRALRTIVERLAPTPAGEAQLQETLSSLGSDDLAHCLACIRDWNTTAQHSLAAHRLLRALLRAAPASELSATPHLKGTLEALIPYAERHFERLDRLIQGSHLLSCTLASMQMFQADSSMPEPAVAAASPATEAPSQQQKRQKR